MPLKTFLNLSADKQKKIINVCLYEFSQYDYESASLSRIVEKLNIAKGSFYRYFENKKELYLYLTNFCRNLINTSTDKILKSSNKNFFDTWLDIFLAMREWEQEYPMIIRFRFKIAQERSNEIFGDKRPEAIKRKIDKVKNTIIEGQQSKQLRSDISPEILSMIILYNQMAIVDYLTIKYNKRFNEPVFSMPIEVMEKDIKNFMSILKAGIQFNM